MYLAGAFQPLSPALRSDYFRSEMRYAARFRAEQRSSCCRTELSEERTHTAFPFTQPGAELGLCRPRSASPCAHPPHLPRAPRQGLPGPLITYCNLFFSCHWGYRGDPSPAGGTLLVRLQGGFHSHTLFLSKHGRGRSSAPPPAARLYQLSHPDSHIITEPAAPAGRRAEPLRGYLRQAGGTWDSRSPAHCQRCESQVHVSGTAPGPLLRRAD